MGCRCKEIDNAERDMNTLRDSIDRIAVIEGYYEELSGYYGDMLNTFKTAVYSSEYKIITAERRVEDRTVLQKDDIQDYKKYIYDNTFSLDSSLGSMESEDERYHNNNDD